jgi:hypothetical protein
MKARSLVISVAFLALGALVARGQNQYTFTAESTISPDWSDQDNWRDQGGRHGVPQAGDTATIPADYTCEVYEAAAAAAVVTVSGTLRVFGTATLTADNVSVASSGAIDVAGKHLLYGLLAADAVEIDGQVTVHPFARLWASSVTVEPYGLLRVIHPSWDFDSLSTFHTDLLTILANGHASFEEPNEGYPSTLGTLDVAAGGILDIVDSSLHLMDYDQYLDGTIRFRHYQTQAVNLLVLNYFGSYPQWGARIQGSGTIEGHTPSLDPGDQPAPGRFSGEGLDVEGITLVGSLTGRRVVSSAVCQQRCLPRG